MWFLGSQETNEVYVILPFYWVACYKPVLDYVYTVPVKFLSGRKFAQFILFIFCLYEAGYFKILLRASVICPSFTTWIWAVQPGSWVTSSKPLTVEKSTPLKRLHGTDRLFDGTGQKFDLDFQIFVRLLPCKRNAKTCKFSTGQKFDRYRVNVVLKASGWYKTGTPWVN